AALLLTLSALARLLATVLRRTDSADMPEPAILKMLKNAMMVLPGDLLADLLTDDGGGELAEPVLEEGERGLEAHGVLRELPFLHLRVDRIAVERGGERHAVLEELLGGDALAGGGGCGEVVGAGRRLLQAGLRAGGGQGSAKIDVTRDI